MQPLRQQENVTIMVVTWKLSNTDMHNQDSNKSSWNVTLYLTHI